MVNDAFQIDGENSKLRRQSSEFSEGNAVNYDRYLWCHFWMTPYVRNTGSCAFLYKHFGSGQTQLFTTYVILCVYQRGYTCRSFVDASVTAPLILFV